MLAYFAVFIFSTFLFWVGEYKTEIKALKKIFLCMAILIPAILAGGRASYIGTDVRVYGKPFFDTALKCNSLSSFLSIQSIYNFNDIGFNILVYLVSLYTKDYHWALFAYEFVSICFIYYAFKRYKKIINIPIWFCMLLYYLLLYNVSLNIMRQTIAVCIICLAVSYLFTKNYFKYLLFVLLGIAFHASAILALGFFPLYFIGRTNLNTSFREQISRFIILCGIFCIVIGLFIPAVKWLVNAHILRSHYLYYLPGGKYSSFGREFNFPLGTFLFQLIYIIIIMLTFKKTMKAGCQPLFFLIVSFVALLISCFGSLFSTSIIRIAYYFVPLQVVGVVSAAVRWEKYARVFITALIVIFIAYWLWTFLYWGNHETIPYVWDWDWI